MEGNGVIQLEKHKMLVCVWTLVLHTLHICCRHWSLSTIVKHSYIEWLVPSYALPNNKKSVALKTEGKCCLKRLSCFTRCKCSLQTSTEGILWQSIFHPCTERPSHHWPPGVKTVCYFQGQCYTDQCESVGELHNTEKRTFKALISFKGFKCRQAFLFSFFLFFPFCCRHYKSTSKGSPLTICCIVS